MTTKPKVVLTVLVCVASVKSKITEQQVTLHSDYRGRAFGVSYRHDYRGQPGEKYQDFASSVAQKNSNLYRPSSYRGYPQRTQYNHLYNKYTPNQYYYDGYRYGRYYAYLSDKLLGYQYPGRPLRYSAYPHGWRYTNPYGKLHSDYAKNASNQQQVKSTTSFFSAPIRILKALEKYRKV